MNKLTISGSITTAAPLVQVSGKDGKDDKQVIRIMKSKVLQHSVAGEAQAQAKTVEVPIISPNTCRTKLREAIGLAMISAAASKATGAGKNFDFMTLMTMFSGGTFVDAKKTINKAYFSEIEELRARNVNISLFGAALGQTGVPGKVSVGIPWPVCIETKEAGLLIPELESMADNIKVKAYQLIAEGFFTRQNKFVNRLNLLTQLTDEGVEQYLKHESDADKTKENRQKEKAKKKQKNADANEAVTVAENDLAEATTEGETEEETVKSGKIQQYQRFEMVVPNTIFSSVITAEGVTDIEIGALIQAFATFAEKPVLGGYSSRGCGFVNMDYNLRLTCDDGKTVELGNIMVRSNSDKPFSYDNPVAIDRYLELFGGYLHDLTMDSIAVPAHFFKQEKKEKKVGNNK